MCLGSVPVTSPHWSKVGAPWFGTTELVGRGHPEGSSPCPGLPVREHGTPAVSWAARGLTPDIKVGFREGVWAGDSAEP